jgi:CRISPR-associated exonuclease Cas4
MTDDDTIPISALQHYSYCPRQCALIHQEQTFTENVHTLRGRRVHEQVDEPGSWVDGELIVETALPLYSEKLGLSGIADVVERLPDGSLRPVEYKHGKRREKRHDDIQAAAQAMCLEEMTGKAIHEAVIYHHSSRRRRVVPITAALRQDVVETVQAVRALLQSQRLPPPVQDAALCRECSLKDSCQPDMIRALSANPGFAANLFSPDEDEI